MCESADKTPSVSFVVLHSIYYPSPTSSRSSAKIPWLLAETPALPSPPSSTDGLDLNDEIEIIAPPRPSAGSSRKRRLSDADADGPPKRPRGVLAGPRVHAVSDPLPRSFIP